MQKILLVISYCAMIILILPVPAYDPSLLHTVSGEGTSGGFPITIASKGLSNETGELVSGAVRDQEVSILLSLTGETAYDYVLVADFRDEAGITINLQWKSGSVEAGEFSDIEFSWLPEDTGSFQVRAFVLTSFESPQILSEVYESSVRVVKTVGELEPVRPPEPADLPDEPDIGIEGKQVDYTVLVYVVASDLESDGYYATADILEMMSVGSTPDVNVIIQTGGAANATIDEYRFIDFTKVQRHLLLEGDVRLLQDLGERNMATSSTLKEFVAWGIGKYPADKYTIVLWDHGSGLIGFGFDNIHNDILDLDELREGLSPAKSAGSKFELIGFDACLMASVEVASALSSSGKFLVASEELEPAWGWDYSSVLSSLKDNPKQSGLELGKVISDSYMAHSQINSELFENLDSDRALTMSVIDLEKVPELVESVADLGKHFDLLAGDMEITHALTRTLHDTERYGEGGKFSAGHLDLYHLADNVDLRFPEFRGIGSSVKSDVEAAVVYRVSGDARQDSHGISIFMQIEEYEANAPYLRFIVGRWISVLTFARNTLENDNLPPVISLTMLKDETISGKIDAEDISYVSTIVTQRVDGSNLRLKILSFLDEEASDFIKTDELGFISYDWNRKVMSLCNGGEQDCRPTSIYFERNGHTKFAFVSARLESDRYNGTLVLMYIVDDSGEKFDFLGGWPGLDEYGNAKRELVPLAEGDRVYASTYLLRYDPVLDDIYFDTVEDATPIIVGEGFGPTFHKYSGDYELIISACDFSGNCGYSPEFEFKVEQEADEPA